MEFRVLGPLEVRANDGRQLAIRARKQRTLLAIMLLRANTLVTDAVLVESLWGTCPPRSALANLRTYAYTLRAVLGRGAPRGAARLATFDSGYRLWVDHDELDLSRFQRLATRGEEAFRRGDMAFAALRLRQALQMWRGCPVEDLDPVGPLRSAVGYLEERRMSLLEKLVDAHLALGEPAEVVGEVRNLVREHPLRERLWEQLMLALCQSGRRAEALSAFREARAVLVEELGVEPGPGLQELHSRVLGGDSPGLLAPIETTGVPGWGKALGAGIAGDPLAQLDTALGEVIERLKDERRRLRALRRCDG